MFCRKARVESTPEEVQARIIANVTRRDGPSQQEMMVMCNRFWLRMVSGVSMMLVGTGVALAGNGFGATAQNIGTNLSDLGGLMQSAFYLSGFGLVGWGIHTMRKAHKEEGQGKAKMSHGALETLFGAGLIAIPTFAGHAVNTLFNNATTATENSTSASVTTN